MKKRLIALILCIATIVSFAVPSTFASGETIGAQLFLDGAAVSEASFPVNEKLTLAVGSGTDGANQWQMFIPAVGAWVNIQGETGVACNVSYAMISNALDGNGQARIRASVNTGSGLVYSNEVVITPERAVLPSSEGGLLMMSPPTVLQQATVNNSNTGSTLTPEEEEAIWAECERAELASGAATEAAALANAALVEAQANYDAAAAAVANHPVALAAQAQADFDAAAAALDAANTAAAEAGDLATAQAAYDAAALALEAAVAAEAENVDQLQAECDAAAAAVAAIQSAVDAAAQAQLDYDAAVAALDAANAAAAEAGDGSAEQAALEAAAVELEKAKTAAAEAEATRAAAVAEYEAADAKLNEMLNAAEAAAAMNTYDTTSETPAAHNVIIEYVFGAGERTGQQAANPWTSNVPDGYVFTGDDYKVISPVIQGYAPDTPVVDLTSSDYSPVTDSITITVEYAPAQVNYSVKYYQQNIYNDGYELVSEVTKQGFTESLVADDLDIEYTGFYALLYNTGTKIAADGSTFVEIKYDRYYYLMNFDLDGGYGTEPVYARYGAAVEVTSPTKAGYAFAGWLDSDTGAICSTDELPKYMPAANKKYIAQWTAQNTTYDVVFWYENADDNKFSQAGVLNNVSAVAGSVVNGSIYSNSNFEGRDSTHFTYSHADENVVIKGDGSTVVNVYFSRNTYKITYVIGDTSVCTIDEHRHSENCGQLTCEVEEHNHNTSGCSTTCNHIHGKECFENVAGDATTASVTFNGTPVNGNIGRRYISYGMGGYYQYYIYIDGTWYRYEGSNGQNYYNNKTVVSPTDCDHANHTDSCYSCGKVTHTHVTGCYDYTCGKYEHYHSGGKCYYIVEEKYDADITAVWMSNPVDAALNKGYVFQSSVTSKYYAFLEKMPGYDVTMTQKQFQGNNKYTWYYYLEVLPGQDTTGLTTRRDGGKTYYQYDSSTVYGQQVSLTYEEDYYPITGFTQRDSSVPSFSNNRIAYLYYVRNSYDLTFSNHGTIVNGKGGTFLYQQDISGQYFKPDYPSTLEPNAYVFDGWYTSPFFGDTKFEFTTKDEDGNITARATMPAKDITLYAKWVPTKHNVNIYLTSEMLAKDKIGETQVVDHRETAAAPEGPVVNGKYTFVGWFYMDGETEKAFDFSMPVTQDLNLYAKWSSNTLMPYTIKYVLGDASGNIVMEDGKPVYVADAITDSALAGTTKTFDAKTGVELYEAYRSGYFPNTNSHSITLDIEDPSKNEFTFIYIPKDKVPYTVKYLEYGTGIELHDSVTYETANAIVTENFKPKTGYMPDAYQKRLVLSSQAEENVIIFWYTKDDVHAPVQVIHYVQNTSGEGYSVYQETTDLNGIKNSTYSTNVLNITGFDYDHATANGTAVTAVDGKVSATVTENGLLLELYYVREIYPYEFKFLEQDTAKVLADSVTGTARYGAQVIQNAKTIPGYDLVSPDAQDIKIEKEDGTTAVKNVRIFYYKEQEVTINYVAVGPEGETDFGEVKPTTETVKAKTEDAKGSTATAEPGFKFVGWYSDAECNTKISDDPTFVPAKENGLNKEATYYAKFEYNLTSLTITKSVANPIAGETFIFTVSGPGINTKIVLTAGESITIKDLPFGVYTVTEDTNWSWRYTPEGGASKTITLSKDSGVNGESVIFVNSRTNDYWLGGDCYAVNTGTNNS